MNICEYTTVTAVRAMSDIQAVSAISDGILLDLIRQASREIEDITNRRFYPQVSTHAFDTPRGFDLLLDDDLLAVTTLTNGDGTTITSGNYKLYPLNKSPKYKLTLLGSAPQQWLRDTYGNREGAITLAGQWGYHSDWGNAWTDVGALLAAAITTTSATTFTVTAGKLQAGQLVQIDSEMIYVISVAPGSPADTATVYRGVNGSPAATHLISAPVLIYSPGGEITNLIKRGAAAYTKLRANPVGESVNIDGLQVITPKDVLKWMDIQLRALGVIRTGTG